MERRSNSYLRKRFGDYVDVHFDSPDFAALSKNHMVVDMHFHSRYSHDSSTTIESIAARAEKLGVYVALTDHNSIGGVLKARELGIDRIKPGIEVTTREGKDILLYFPAVDELEEFFSTHIAPYVKNKSSLRSGRTGVRMRHLLAAASESRALIAIAHPFAVGARRSYLFFKRRDDICDLVHAIEVANQALPHKSNLLAIGWAAECGKSIIAGSDGHIVGMLGSSFTYAKANSWEEFLEKCKEGRAGVIGEKRKLRHHLTNIARILKEKGKVLENRRIRNGTR